MSVCTWRQFLPGLMDQFVLSPTALVDCNVHCTETYDPGSSREGGAVQCNAAQQRLRCGTIGLRLTMARYNYWRTVTAIAINGYWPLPAHLTYTTFSHPHLFQIHLIHTKYGTNDTLIM